MEHLYTRTLPRLMLDTVHCLLIAHDHVDHSLRSETRQTITSLRKADITDVIKATSVLKDALPHLRDLERSLKAANRSLAAQKIRDLRYRVVFVTAAYGAQVAH